jgi:hypothetical protein
VSKEPKTTVAPASRPRFGELNIRNRARTRGVFWQGEYYDHLIRNEPEFERAAVRYAAANPAKANLKAWKWVWVRGRDGRATAAEDGGATQIA